MRNRICSTLIALAVLFGLAVPAGAVGTEPAPTVEIEINRVKNGSTVEASLIVHGTDAAQSVYAVLEYDPGKLVLKQWGANGDKIIPSATPVAANTMAPGGVAGKPSLVYQPDGGSKAYLYLGAGDLKAGLGEDMAVVTVQFAYAEGVSPLSEAELLAAIDLAPAGTFDQFALMPCPATLSVYGSPAVRYVYGMEVASGDYRALEKPKTVYTSKESLYSGGGGGMTGGYSITFFDWDGSVLSAVSGEGDMRAAVAELEDRTTVLRSKAGYDFDAWLTVTSDSEGLHTQNGTLTSSKDGVPAGNPDVADFSNVQSNLLVQAAYKTNAGVNSGQGADGLLTEDTARYVIGEPTFYQYGISPDDVNGQYAVRCTVDRGSVLRADEPTVLAMVYVGSGSNMKAVTVKVDLDSTDSTSFEVVVPKATTSITFTVLDTYGVTAWTMGTSRSNEGSAAKSEIVKGGSFALLVDEAWVVAQGGEWTSYVNAQCFQDAGYPKVNMGNLAAAKTAIVNASQVAGGTLDRAAADTALADYK